MNLLIWCIGWAITMSVLDVRDGVQSLWEMVIGILFWPFYIGRCLGEFIYGQYDED